jgi:hypothetical protein
MGGWGNVRSFYFWMAMDLRQKLIIESQFTIALWGDKWPRLVTI